MRRVSAGYLLNNYIRMRLNFPFQNQIITAQYAEPPTKKKNRVKIYNSVLVSFWTRPTLSYRLLSVLNEFDTCFFSCNLYFCLIPLQKA